MALSEHEGIIDPSVDSLLKKADSKYGLVLFGARRARQINAYYSQLQEGLFEHVGPLVDTAVNEKSLSIAMREIEEDLLESHPVEGGRYNENGQLIHDDEPVADFFGSDIFANDAESTDTFVAFSEEATEESGSESESE
ncbi:MULTISPECIES: DNA-directed RNA polymerase subunit omega [Micrococcaceae]|uniref:DNA-directed RNA polymerase subunit omega n=1 Tax=unclassified Kocuria TaxID=2649579 RepID=UPI001013AD99|nr:MULTISPECIES: DNA-directed RNA polymerase subunit omega [unclassified Kocuria]